MDESLRERMGLKGPEKRLADLDYNLDRRKSFDRLTITEEAGPDLVMVMEVTKYGARMGALVIRCRGDAETGKVGCEGVSLFSEREIQDGELESAGTVGDDRSGPARQR